jgi:hypothetical protein
MAEIVPFTEEGELPPFQHGSLGLHYFQILRGVLSKHIRASIHLETLEENKRRHQIPRGLKIMKNLNAVEPTYQLKLKHMQIMGKAEIEMLESLIGHYPDTLPKLINDFTLLFDDASKELQPVEKRLVVIKLLHYKNELVNEKKTLSYKKLSSQQERTQEPVEHPNGCNPQMGQPNRHQNYTQQRPTQQYRQQNRQPRNQASQQNMYRPRSQQNQNWDEDNTTENWQEEPKEQRQNKRRGRGRGRM